MWFLSSYKRGIVFFMTIWHQCRLVGTKKSKTVHIVCFSYSKQLLCLSKLTVEYKTAQDSLSHLTDTVLLHL